MYNDLVDNSATSTGESLFIDNRKYAFFLKGYVAFFIPNVLCTEEPLLFVELLPEVGIIIRCWEDPRAI